MVYDMVRYVINKIKINIDMIMMMIRIFWEWKYVFFLLGDFGKKFKIWFLLENK